MRTQDARIPVMMAADSAALTAALLQPEPVAVLAQAGCLPSGLPPGLPREEFAPEAARHVLGCACCAGRSPAAMALDRLFQARARGKCAWFARVLVLAPTESGRAQIAAALRGDALTAARYRAARA